MPQKPKKRSKVVWLTGVSGAGKSTIAQYMQKMHGYDQCMILDADIARALWPELGLSDRDRSQNVRRLGALAFMLASQMDNVLILVANIAPFIADRRANQKLIMQAADYYEVYIHAPLIRRLERDPKGLYDKAVRGEIQGLTGYDGVYEQSPSALLLSIDTSRHSPGECASLILETLETID